MGIKVKSDRYVLLFLAVVLFAVYGIAVWVPFGFLDDYHHLDHVLAGAPQFGPFFAATRMEGRFVEGLLFSLFFRPTQIADQSSLRVISITGIVLLAWTLYRTFRLFLTQSVSILLALLICVMPSFQAWLAWVTLMFVPLGAVLGGVAARVVERANEERTIRRQAAYTLAGVICLLLALGVYQPAAMFYWVFAAFLLLLRYGPNGRPWRLGIRYLGVGGAALAADFGVMKLAQFVSGGGVARTALVSDLGSKLNWFLREFLVNGLSFSNLSVSPQIAVAWAGVIVVGLWFFLGGSLWRRGALGGIALAFVSLTSLSSLVIAENWASYRTQAPLTALLVVYAFLALLGFSKLLRPQRIVNARVVTAVLGIATAIALALGAYYMAFYFALPQNLELTLMRNRLQAADLARVNEIYVIRASWFDSAAPSVRYDEFGMPSSFPPWGAESMARDLVREIDPAHSRIPICSSTGDAVTTVPASTLVIDMRQLRAARFRAREGLKSFAIERIVPNLP